MSLEPVVIKLSIFMTINTTCTVFPKRQKINILELRCYYVYMISYGSVILNYLTFTPAMVVIDRLY